MLLCNFHWFCLQPAHPSWHDKYFSFYWFSVTVPGSYHSTLFRHHSPCSSIVDGFNSYTSNNQRLGSVDDNDRRSKCFCSNPGLCVDFTWQMVKTRVIRVQGEEGRYIRDQIASPNEYWLQTCDACTIRTWAGLFKVGFRWPRVSAKVEFRYKSLKSLIPFTSFCQQVDDWILLKITEKII